MLTGLKLRMGAINPDSAEDAANLVASREIIDMLMEDVRAMSLSLRPAMLDQLGLTAATKGHVNRRMLETGIRPKLDLDDVPLDLPNPTATLCFRCIQEALKNVIKHSAAERVEVKLRHTADRIEITVRDDGRGFELPRYWRVTEQGGFGIPGMIERFKLAGGSFQISSSVGHGTTVSATVPLTVELVEAPVPRTLQA